MEPTTNNLPTQNASKTNKLDRLNDLREMFLRLEEMQGRIYDEAMEITGESAEEPNNHTWDFIANETTVSAEELLAAIDSNPSELWHRSVSGPDEEWPEFLRS